MPGTKKMWRLRLVTTRICSRDGTGWRRLAQRLRQALGASSRSPDVPLLPPSADSR